ncbi:MAG: hypothetical protein Q9181_007829 [Wetmoreana brouardii]
MWDSDSVQPQTPGDLQDRVWPLSDGFEKAEEQPEPETSEDGSKTTVATDPIPMPPPTATEQLYPPWFHSKMFKTLVSELRRNISGFVQELERLHLVIDGLSVGEKAALDRCLAQGTISVSLESRVGYLAAKRPCSPLEIWLNCEKMDAATGESKQSAESVDAVTDSIIKLLTANA